MPKQKQPRVVILKSKRNGRYYPRIKSRNGKILPETDGYRTARAARNTLASMWRNLNDASIASAPIVHE